MKRTYLSLVLATLSLLLLPGCRQRPSFAVGDYLIPLGSSDPTQIVTVVAVDKDGYRVAIGTSVGPNATTQTKTRKKIDSYYVRVAALPIGGSWATATPSPTPTPAPSATPHSTAQSTATPVPTTTPTP